VNAKVPLLGSRPVACPSRAAGLRGASWSRERVAEAADSAGRKRLREAASSGRSEIRHGYSFAEYHGCSQVIAGAPPKRWRCPAPGKRARPSASHQVVRLPHNLRPVIFAAASRGEDDGRSGGRPVLQRGVGAAPPQDHRDRYASIATSATGCAPPARTRAVPAVIPDAGPRPDGVRAGLAAPCFPDRDPSTLSSGREQDATVGGRQFQGRVQQGFKVLLDVKRLARAPREKVGGSRMIASNRSLRRSSGGSASSTSSARTGDRRDRDRSRGSYGDHVRAHAPKIDADRARAAEGCGHGETASVAKQLSRRLAARAGAVRDCGAGRGTAPPSSRRQSRDRSAGRTP